jgi:hypothetical protein
MDRDGLGGARGQRRHEFDAWFPYGSSKTASSILNKIPITDTDTLRMDVDPAKQALEAFVTCCICISMISVQLAQALGHRAGSNLFDRLTKRLLREVH